LHSTESERTSPPAPPELVDAVAGLAETLDDEDEATSESSDDDDNDDDDSLDDGVFHGAGLQGPGLDENDSDDDDSTFRGAIRKKRSVVPWVTHSIFKHTVCSNCALRLFFIECLPS
jgi:hypothetical protein